MVEFCITFTLWVKGTSCMSNILSQYKSFLEKLAKNPYDETTHRVFSDWLDEHDQPEEAQTHREWTKEKQKAEDFLKDLSRNVGMTWEEFLKNGDEIATGHFCF